MTNAGRVAATPDPVVGLLGATGLIGGGFMRQCADLKRVTFGRTRAQDRQIDLEGPVDARLFNGIDLLIHAAGVRDEDLARDREAALRRATEGNRALYRAAFRAGVRRVIHVSSAHVYGSLERGIDETSVPEPTGEYGRAHLAGEAVLAEEAHAAGATALAVRPNAVFGMTFDPSRFGRWTLVPFAFPKAALTGEIRVNAPRVRRNFVSTRNIAEQALARLASLREPGLHILNPVGPDTLSMQAFAERCAAAARRAGARAVRVVLADNPAGSDSGFDYRSLHAAMPATSDLETFLTDYFTWLGSAIPVAPDRREFT